MKTKDKLDYETVKNILLKITENNDDLTNENKEAIATYLIKDKNLNIEYFAFLIIATSFLIML